MNFFQLRLRELIKRAEEDFNINKFFHYEGNDTIVKFRHLYLKCLLKDQLKHFDRS